MGKYTSIQSNNLINRKVNFGDVYSCKQESTGNSFSSSDGKFKVSWTLIGTDKINFTMEAQYTGWISIGLNAAAPKMSPSIECASNKFQETLIATLVGWSEILLLCLILGHRTV